MEPVNKTEELKQIFLFLGGKEENQNELKRKTENIFYGLNHYGLKMDQDKKDVLKNALLNKTDNEGNIDFEDFKECFDLKKKDKKKKKEGFQNNANQIFFLILELVGLNKTENQKLSKNDVKKLFNIVFCLDQVDIDTINPIDSNINVLNIKNSGKIDRSLMQNKSQIGINNNSQILKAITKNMKNTQTPLHKDEKYFAKILKQDFENKNKDLAKELVNSIDLDEDGYISLSDFEIFIKKYFEYKNNVTIG